MSGKVARPTDHAGLLAKIGFSFIQASAASRRGLIQLGNRGRNLYAERNYELAFATA
jgi:hypothetical protein